MPTSTDATAAHRWANMYNEVPLGEVPRHFASMNQSSSLLHYLTQVLRLCPRGGHTCEIGNGSGYGAIWLSLRGIQAEGIDVSPNLVERARQINNLLGGHAAFRHGELSAFSSEELPRYDVIHHQGILHQISVPAIRAALAQQVTSAEWVVFSVPSVFYPLDSGSGNERLLPLEEWRQILSPFDITELKYYGDPYLGSQEQIIAILRGRPVNDALRTLTHLDPQPYPEGISAIVHTRNEARNITACLQTLQGWTDEIIVCDMESNDGTVEIARTFTDQIIHHPWIANFDRARNVSAMRAHYRWIMYLDADERVPALLGQHLRHLTLTQGETFDAMLLPMRHYFSGHWMQCLYPGYTAPRLLRNGRFFFNPRLHSGAQVDGQIILFPADNPDLAIEHFSYDSMAHYLDKLNRYTDGESENMQRDSQPFHWQDAIARFVQDFQSYYDYGNAPIDGVHGFVYAFLGGFYRFEQHAKLYERRFHQGQLQEAEKATPRNVEEVLSFALEVCRQKPRPAVPEIRLASDRNGPRDRASVVWSGPIYDTSGYGEESRHLLLALDASLIASRSARANAGATSSNQNLLGPSISMVESADTRIANGALSAQALPWGEERPSLTSGQERRLVELSEQAVYPGFVHVLHTMASHFHRLPQAGIAIGRTMFETDRLPPAWVRACNRMDYIWVPSTFNQQTFIRSGVSADKIIVIPECLDADQYRGPLLESALPAIVQSIQTVQKFTFLTVFDWTWHKGWDVLLRAFLEEFDGQDDVQLILKVRSNGYSNEEIQSQAARHVQEHLNCNLLADNRIRFVHGHLDQEGMRGLYQAADCFVMPSRGEGWGRPYMEAMACAVPVIGTGWSGNTAFMTEENSYLLDYTLVAVPEIGWREAPTYQGHRWAEPDGKHLRTLLRRVCTERGEAARIAAAGQETIFCSFGYQAVGPQIAAELARVWEITHPHPVMTTSIVNESTQVLQVMDAQKSIGIDTGSSHDEGNHDGTATKSIPTLPAPPTEGKRTRRTKKTNQKDHNPTEGSQTASGATDEGMPDGSRETRRPTTAINVRWEGAFFNWHSLAHVNRELVSCLLQSGMVNLSLIPTEAPDFSAQDASQYRALAERVFAPLPAPQDKAAPSDLTDINDLTEINVRHAFPPRFTPPDTGHLVLMQPWEYGYLPREWIAPIQQHVTEVWCNSSSVRDAYLASGISAEKLRMVPLGVDITTFSPDAPPYIFTTEPGALRQLVERDAEPFTFLFVGGTLHRKGIDILLDAYLKAFSAYDGVRLIVKDTGTQTVYRGQTAHERILALTQDATRPQIIYLADDLSAAQLAGVYTAADCLVQPYRGEGFCLPALEAMACAIPVIVPEGGPTDDFVDETVGWRIKAQRLSFGDGSINTWECTGQPWMLEVSSDDLARLLRRVFQDRAEAKTRGSVALERVREGWTWEHSCEAAYTRLRALAELPSPTRSAASASNLPAARRSEESGKPVTVPSSEKSLTVQANADQSETNVAQITATKAVDDQVASATGLSYPIVSSPADGRPTISLCMIVRNEERVLEDCLASIKPWVDEIIVVDTGSSDKTVEIAQKHGARVFHFPWCDDFSAARNASLQHATADWILWMDADDTILEDCGRQLKDAVLLAEEGVTGLIMQVQIPPGPGEVGFTVVDHVKLFRNHLGLRFEGRIHEQILEPISRLGGKVERTNLSVVHSGYDYSPEGQAKKRTRDLLLLEKDLADRPEHPFVLFNIGMTAFHMKDFPKAVEFLQRCLARTQPHESIVRKVYAMLAGSYQGLNNLPQAIDTLRQGLTLFPGDPEILFRAGVIYHLAGQLDEAEASYIRLLTSREVGHIDSLDVSMTGFKAHHNLALVYQDVGKWEQAETEWCASVAAEPSFAPSWAGLAQLYWQQGRLTEHQAVMHRIGQIDIGLAQTLQQNLAIRR